MSTWTILFRVASTCQTGCAGGARVLVLCVCLKRKKRGAQTWHLRYAVLVRKGKKGSKG